MTQDFDRLRKAIKRVCDDFLLVPPFFFNMPQSFQFPSYVYVMKAGQTHVKIGVSDDPAARLTHLQIGCPWQIELVAAIGCDSSQLAKSVELDTHKRMSDCRVRGEWFSCEPMTAVFEILLVIIERESRGVLHEHIDEKSHSQLR